MSEETKVIELKESKSEVDSERREYKDHELLNLPPDVLQRYLKAKYGGKVLPQALETVEDMKYAGKFLSLTMAWHNYLAEMTQEAKLIKKRKQLENAPQKEIAEAMSREDLFRVYAESMKNLYDGISRMGTFKSLELEIERMTDSVPERHHGRGYA